jgi:DNA-binding CsgD family transcriptional regulator
MNISKQSIEFNKSIITELSEINRPLIQSFGVFLFTYRKLKKDGTLLHLTTQEKWVEQSMQKNLLVSNEIVPKIIQTIEASKQSFLWSGNMKDPLYNSLHSFNIWNGITFYQNYSDYIEIIAFASTKENESAANFYINNLDLLEHFIGYFKSQTRHILYSEDFLKLSTNVKDKIPIFEENDSLIKSHAEFFKKTKFLRYYFSGKYEHIYLTQREAEILFYITQGKSFKEIARILTRIEKSVDEPHSMSERTVECHWNSIKCKFDITDRSKIIDIFLESNIQNQIAYLNRIKNNLGCIQSHLR